MSGFYYNHKVHIERVFSRKRHLVVKWYDEVCQKWDEKEFDFEQLDEALEFAKDKLNALG